MVFLGKIADLIIEKFCWSIIEGFSNIWKPKSFFPVEIKVVAFFVKQLNIFAFISRRLFWKNLSSLQSFFIGCDVTSNSIWTSASKISTSSFNSFDVSGYGNWRTWFPEVFISRDFVPLSAQILLTKIIFNCVHSAVFCDALIQSIW